MSLISDGNNHTGEGDGETLAYAFVSGFALEYPW